jgi:hypothetical protein
MIYPPNQMYQQPQNFVPQAQNYMMQTQPQMSSNRIWAQGEAGAKAYLVAPNTSVDIWDSEAHTIYVKSADRNGMPSMQIIDYTIRGESPKLEETSQYVRIEEFNALKDELDNIKEQLKRSVRQENRSKQNRPKGGADL